MKKAMFVTTLTDNEFTTIYYSLLVARDYELNRDNIDHEMLRKMLNLIEVIQEKTKFIGYSE